MATRGKRSALPADERYLGLPIEALECRVLRHQWPRYRQGSNKLIPTKRRYGKVTEERREMTCLGECGTVRIDDFEVDAEGRRHRLGRCRYRHEKKYALDRHKPGEPPQERAAFDEVHFCLLTRMYADLTW